MHVSLQRPIRELNFLFSGHSDIENTQGEHFNHTETDIAIQLSLTIMI